MRSGTAVVLAVAITLIICGVAFGAYTMYSDMQEQNEQLNQSLQQVQQQLNETQNNSSNTATAKSDTSKSSSSSSSSGSTSKAKSSSGNKVTYEEAGVDKSVGYLKTCKYPGCGARYDSRLAYCPKCGHKNIYV